MKRVAKTFKIMLRAKTHDAVNLLNANENAGITLTESLAMYPAASVCGWYFSHPESTYFGINKITDDQLHDYAHRKGMSVEDISKWLSPILE